jgi:shikimate kinase
MKIAIVGYMASGKSLVGKSLAEDLGVPFVDLDQEIEKATGQTLSELLPIKNGLHFRKIEREVLLRILEQPKFVLSCGGGTPCYYNNMEEINGKTHSFYLQVTPKTLADRLQSEKQNRPLVASTEDKDLFEFVAKHLFERRPFYEMANHSVRGEDKIEQIIRILKGEQE